MQAPQPQLAKRSVRAPKCVLQLPNADEHSPSYEGALFFDPTAHLLSAPQGTNDRTHNLSYFSTNAAFDLSQNRTSEPRPSNLKPRTCELQTAATPKNRRADFTISA